MDAWTVQSHHYNHSFIPYNEKAEGRIVNDAYFGKIPADRLKMANGLIYFKIDGKLRSNWAFHPHVQRVSAAVTTPKKACSPSYAVKVRPKMHPISTGSGANKKTPSTAICSTRIMTDR